MVIKFNIKGKILKGDYSPNGEILIEENSDSPGTYYIYIWPKDGTCWPNSEKEMLYDDWLENYERLLENIEDRNWEIDWDFEKKTNSKQ
ncbi:MAG: hypothetical protein AABY27_00760 [Pseudomonadota bacterium]